MSEAERHEFLTSRMHHPPTNAATFLENQIRIPGEEAPIFINSLNRVDSLEVARQQQRLSNELWEQANDERERLLSLLEQVRAKLDKNDPKALQVARLNTKRYTWDNVISEVNSLASRWSSSPKRASKMLYLDRLGRNSESFQAWLGLLPTGDFGSSICGVFTIALNAASQYVKVEDAIFDALIQIPEAVSDTRQYLKLYAQTKDHRLEERTFDLYLSILRALGHILKFFVESSAHKFAGALFKQSSYHKELLSSLEDVQLKVSKVKDESSHCMQRRMAEMQTTILKIDHNSTNISHMLQTLYKQLLLQEERFVSQLSGSTANALESEATSDLATASRNSEQSITRSTYNKKQSQNLLKGLEFFGFNPATASRDIQMTLKHGYASGETSQAKAAKLIESPELKDYLLDSERSSPLLIYGNEDMSTAEGVSPLSLVSARIAVASDAIPQIMLLSFFCAEHPAYGGSSRSTAPTRMMANLVGQLLTKLIERLGSVDSSFLRDRQLAEIQAMDLNALCTLFSELAKKIPEKTILLCLIDGIDLYNTAALRSDTDTIIRRIARQVQKRDTLVFKLIATCRGRAGPFRTHFMSAIDMDDSVEQDDSSQWTIANTNVLGRLTKRNSIGL